MGGVLELGMDMSRAPVFLVGGSDLFRRGLRGFLEGSSFETVGEFTAYRDCVEAAGDRPLPALILYVSTGVIDESAGAVDALLGAYDRARLIVLSSVMSVEELGSCLRMGARGYLLTSISKDALTHSLALILLGETVFPSDLARALMGGGPMVANPAVARKLENLTMREVDILHCLTEGLSNKQIARRLGIQEATVKIHVKSLIGKLGVVNRTQAALWAVRAGVGNSPENSVA
jgi:two-component system, NarL family, nitrate/nitrite response regulator NarL